MEWRYRTEREVRLTSHLWSTSGQSLFISRRVYIAGGAVSNARPLRSHKEPFLPLGGEERGPTHGWIGKSHSRPSPPPASRPLHTAPHRVLYTLHTLDPDR